MSMYFCTWNIHRLQTLMCIIHHHQHLLASTYTRNFWWWLVSGGSFTPYHCYGFLPWNTLQWYSTLYMVRNSVINMLNRILLIRLDQMRLSYNYYYWILGPLVFLVAMCRTRVSFLFKRYFCIDECWCCCCKGSGGQFKEQEFIEEECQELATIDMLKEKYEQSSDPMPETKRLTNGILNGTLGRSVDVDKELSMSLFNVKSKREPGDVLPPSDPDAPIGRVRRLLKSNSLTALANINFGWRRETSV